MKTNSKLVLNGDFTRKEHGTLNYAKNIQLSEDYKAVEGEDGFHEMPQLHAPAADDYKVLGHLVIDSDVVIFANITITGVKYFCIVLHDGIAQSQTTILKTIKINVDDTNRISADYTFNSAKDRIISWCDGLTTTSNRPYNLNIDTNELIIDSLSRELLVDVKRLSMFTDVVPLRYDVSILNGGSLTGGAYYITTRVYYADDIISPWDVIDGPYYVGDEAGKQTSNSIKIQLHDLPFDTKEVELAVIRKSEGVVTSKIKNRYPITFENASLNVDNNAIISFADNEGTDIDLTELLVKSSNFSKIGVLAKVNNKQYAGGVEEEDSFINYQKYANDVVVTWEQQSASEMLDDTKCFQEGEVYGFNISLQLKSGALTPPFHIPGRKPTSTIEGTNSKDPSNDNFYHSCPSWLFQDVYASDTLTVTDFKTISHIGDIKSIFLNIISKTVVVATVEYPTLSDFYNLTNAVININDVDFTVLSDNRRLLINHIPDGNDAYDPEISNIPYHIDVYGNTATEPTFVFIGDRFELNGKEFAFHGAHRKSVVLADTYPGTTVRKEGTMAYWENTNENYKVDDTVIYPIGKVRHHRFPMIKEMGFTGSDLITYRNVKLKPVFSNIHIPDDIRHLVKGVTISYFKKEVSDKTVFPSTIQPLIIQDVPNIQSITYYPSDKSSRYGNRIYCKLLNDDITRSNSNNIINYIIPLATENLPYNITSPQTGSSDYNLEISSLNRPAVEPDIFKPFSKYIGTNSSDEDEEFNALLVVHQKVANFGQKGFKLDDLVFDNTGSDGFIGIVVNWTVYHPQGYDKSIDFYNCIMNKQHVWDDDYNLAFGGRNPHEGQGGHNDHMYMPPYNNTKDATIPYTYAYSRKEDVHFGFNSNHDTVIASNNSIDSSNFNGEVSNNVGDVIKDAVEIVNTMFPYSPTNDEFWQYSYDNKGLYKEDGLDSFLTKLSEFNSGNDNILSWSKHYVQFSGITDIRKYYTKDDTDKLIANDGLSNKVPYANPLADHTPYYDKDYNDVNIYGAPIVDPSYKYKVTDAFNVVAWSDTANDVRTNIANLRTFRSSNRYYLPIEDGTVVQLIAKLNMLYIQQEDNLSLARVKDALDSDDSKVFVGSGDIFDRPPIPITNTINERIRCGHALHCQDTMIGICIIDNYNKSVYTVLGNKVTAISHVECDSFFKKNLTAGYQNPFKGEGWIIASNNLKNVIYITSLDPNNLWTISFNAVLQGWHCLHDYHDMYMINAVDKFYSINKGYLYHHGKTNKGIFYRNDDQPTLVAVAHRSYIDMVVSAKPEDNKVFEAVIFRTKYWDVATNSYRFDKSISSILVYNDSQCCLLKDIKSYHGDVGNDWYKIEKRNVGADWVVNDFRDSVVDNLLPFLDGDKEVIDSNLSDVKEWYNSDLIISNAGVVRLQLDNETTDNIVISDVSVYVRKSNV